MASKKHLILIPVTLIVSLIVGTNSGLRINKEGLELLTKYEQCTSNQYVDLRGIPTQGCGDTNFVTKKNKTKEQVAKDLVNNLQEFENCVNTYFDGASMNDNQFSAMVVLTYNIGCTNAKGKSKPTNLRTLALNHNYKDMCHRIRAFNKSGGEVIKGLDNRRKEEEVLCLKPVKG